MPEPKRQRKEYRTKLATTAAASLDSAIAPARSGPSDDTNPSHREDFTSLLRAAAKTKTQDDQT